jgi:putative peptidoglycan lipid II flippase
VSAVVLMPRLQILGLALSNTIQNSAHALILLALLFASFGTLAGRGIPGAVFRACLAALVMGIAVVTSARLLSGLVNVHTLAGQAMDVVLPTAIGATLYVAVAALLRSEELVAIRNIALRRTV